MSVLVKEIEMALVTLLNVIPEGVVQNVCDELDALEEQIKDASSFEDEGVPTNNDGLVLTLADGSEFQITIVQSKRAR